MGDTLHVVVETTVIEVDNDTSVEILTGNLPLGTDLTALEQLSGTGIVTRTGSGTYALRELEAGTGVSISRGNGVAGNPVISATTQLGGDLTAIEALTGTGLAARTADDTWALRTLTAPAAGITVANGGGVAGNPTLALADDLAALEALATTGWAKRTGSNTWDLGTPTYTEVGAAPAVGQTTVAAGSAQHNLDLTGYWDIRLAPTGSHLITGIVADTAARTKTIRNTGPYIVGFVLESSSSTAANRLQTEEQGGHLFLMPGDVAMAVYDSTDSRWTVIPLRSVWSDIGRGSVRWLRPASAGAPPQSVPFASGTGSWVCPVPTTASMMEARFRNTIASAAGSGSAAGMGSSNAIRYALPSSGTHGGFGWTGSWGFEVLTDQVDDTFVGLSADDSVGVGNPFSQLINTAGFLRDNGETVWQFAHNDGAGNCTKVPLTGYTIAALDLFRGFIWWDRSQSAKLSYALWKQNDLTVVPAIGDVDSNLPAAAMFTKWQTINRSANSRTIMFDEFGIWTP